jgi:hypothetical protein
MDAFDGLAPLDEAYASKPVAAAFDWRSVASRLPVGREWYLVAFRSVRRDGVDEARLCEFDDRAHAEAATAPGFVHYFRGPTSSDGSCLSFCLWDSRADARAAAGRPAHQEAISLIREMYDRYALEFLRVSRPDAAAGLTFEAYDVAPAPRPSIDPGATPSFVPLPNPS